MGVLAELLETPYIVQGVCIALLAVFVSSFWDDLADEIPYGRVPLVGKNWWDLSNKKAKSRFTRSARELIAEGFAKVEPSSWARQESMLTSPGNECLPGHGRHQAADRLAPQVCG